MVRMRTRLRCFRRGASYGLRREDNHDGLPTCSWPPNVIAYCWARVGGTQSLGQEHWDLATARSRVWLFPAQTDWEGLALDGARMFQNDRCENSFRSFDVQFLIPNGVEGRTFMTPVMTQLCS